MSLSEYILDVKNTVTLTDVMLGMGVKVPKSGLINCPFPDHNDSTASLKVYDRSDFFKCFGRCNRKGDIFDFVMGMNGIELFEAIRYISDNHGVNMYRGDKCDVATVSSDTALVHVAMEFLVDYAYKMLRDPIHKKILDNLIAHYGYDKTRGLDYTRTGFLPGGTGFLKALFAEFGEGEDLLVRMGVATRGEHGVRNFFQNRIIHPYLKNGKVVYMIARRLPWEGTGKKESGKYLKQSVKNTSTVPCISNKWLYNEDFVHSNEPYVIITEGCPDVISAWEKGFNVMSPCTNKLKEEDAKYLAKKLRNFKDVFICNDSEIKGQGDAGAVQMYTLLKQAGKECRIARLPLPKDVGKVDLNGYLKTHTKEELQVILDTSKTYLAERIHALSAIPDATTLRVEVETLQKYVGDDSIAISTAVQDIYASCSKLPKKTLKDILKEQSKKGKTKKKNSVRIREEIICDVGGRRILRGDNIYMEVYVSNEEEVRTSIANFTLELIEKKYEVLSIDGTGDIEKGNSQYMYRVHSPGVPSQDLHLRANDMTSLRAFLNACGTQGINITHNLNDTRIANILNAEARAKNAEVGYISKIGRIGGSNFIAGNVIIIAGKVYTSDNGRFVLDDGRVLVVGEMDPTNDQLSFQKIYLKTEEPYPEYISDVLNEVFNVYAYQGAWALSWLFAGHYRPEVIDCNGCFSICSVTGARGTGKTYLLDILKGIVGGPPVANITSTPASMMRKMDHYSCIPLLLEEYRQKEAKQKDSIFRSIYNNDTVDRASLSNQTGIVCYKANSTLIFCGQDVPADAALYQRLAEVNLGDAQLDKEYCTEHLSPLKKQISYLYFDHIRKPLIPSTVVAEEICANKNIIEKYILKHGRNIISRQVDNWAPILWAFRRFYLPHLKAKDALEGFLSWILFKISESDNIDKGLDPMLGVLDFIREIDMLDDVDISTMIRVNEKEGQFQIRWSPLVKLWRDSVITRDDEPIGKTAIIKQFISAFRIDMIGDQVRAYFSKGGKFGSQRCTLYNLKARTPRLRELIDHFTGDGASS